MMRRALASLAIAGLLALTPAAAGAEDPFAEDEDPFDDEDPFAEYESQLAETVDATESMAAEDDGGDDGAANDSGADGGSGGAESSDEQTKDSPGFGLGLLATAGALGALAASRER